MKTSLSKKLGLRIKEIRESKKIKQVELAELIGMEPSNLSKLESGNQLPKEENIEKIANALNISVSELFNFAHKKSVDELKKELTNMINSLNTEQLEFTYKFVINLKLLS